jgi:4-amino-4-deoxy-L-arabinose transferase-like glycosyltransferase
MNTELGSQIAWLLPMSLGGGLLVAARRRLRPSPLLATTIIFGGWFLTAAGAFSITKGIVHPYYLSSVGPPAAALIGLGLRETAMILRERSWRWLVIPIIALVGTALVQWTVLRRPDSVSWRPWLQWVALAGAAVGVLVLASSMRRSQRTTGFVAIGAGAMLIASPLLWTQSSLAAGVTPQLPYAQATGLEGGRPGLQPNGGFTFLAGDQDRLIAYLRSKRSGERWLVAVQSAAPAEAIIIPSGEPVMTLGGFIGSDQIITEAQLRAKIAAGEIRFFLVGAGMFGQVLGGRFGSGSASSFVPEECALVPPENWQSGPTSAGETSFPGGPTSGVFSLYDCASR